MRNQWDNRQRKTAPAFCQEYLLACIAQDNRAAGFFSVGE
jgi:hypothetical protein